MENTEKRIRIVRKSMLIAGGQYDYKKLTDRKPQFLDCGYTEEKEEIHFTYDIHHLKPYEEVFREPIELRLVTLIDVLQLYELAQEFNFSLNPENLYYDRNRRVYVMDRDIYARGETFSMERFLAEVKALAGCTLWKKYSFNDYINGGLDLMKKHKLLKMIHSLENREEIIDYLTNQYDRIMEEKRLKKVEIYKNSHQRKTWYAVLSTVFLAAACAGLGYLYIVERPLEQAIIAADSAFLEMDYIRVIDSLKEVDFNSLDQPQKYILAVSYIKSESLSIEQKDNILSALTIRGEEKLKDYWIYLGRLEVKEAENIAMQRSDDELLLYAYLKEKSLLETNTQISGEEKAQMLTTLDGKIKPLADKYTTEEDTH